MAALSVVVAAIFAVSALIGDRGARTLRKHALLAPCLVWLAYTFFQTIPLPASLVGMLSGGSEAAYSTWIEPLLDSGKALTSFPISVDVYSTRHATAFLAIICLLVWTSAMVFTTRARLVFLLSSISVGGSIIALLGIWRLIDPSFSLWSISPDAGGAPFSTFVNRNNAALMLNLGFAAGLGLICWRLAALTGAEIDDETFEFSDLVSLLGDRYALLGVVGLVLCGTGLAVCGSRGGIVAAITGTMLALGWVRQRRGVVSLPVVGILLVICSAILIVPTNLNLRSIERIDQMFDQEAGGIMRDGRLKHLPDGIRAARAYLPAGSGLSTYGHAHLPYQKTGSESWYVHADNLWLELFAEQGIPGVIFALIIFGIIIHSLYFLHRSPDPMDQGVRISGWYAVGAILTSQAFDFGLIVPANLLLVSCLFPAIIVRRVAAAVLVPSDDGPPATPKIFQYRGFVILAVVLPVALLLFAIPSLKKLRNDANAEHVQWVATQEMKTGAKKPEELQELSNLIASQIEDTPSPELFDWLFRVEFQRLRFDDVVAANPDSETDVVDLFRETSRRARRLSTGMQDESQINNVRREIEMRMRSRGPPSEAHQNLLNINERSIRALPLGRNARSEHVSLEYVHRNESRVTAAIEQLRRLYAGNSRALVDLGLMTAETGRAELATEIFRDAIAKKKHLARKVLEMTEPFDNINQSALLPPIPEVHRQIASTLLANWKRQQTPQLRQLLSTVKEGLACDTCRTGSERAVCEEYSGDIAVSQGNRKEAIEAYERALTFTPTKLVLWKKTIDQQRSLGDIPAARSAARKAAILLPNEADFFRRVIKELAEEEVRGIDASKLNDASTIEK